MKGEKSVKDRVKDAIGQYGPTAVALAQLGLDVLTLSAVGLAGR